MQFELTSDEAFEFWIAYIFEVEGGYSDVKHDRGGKTHWGLTETYLRRLKVELPQNKAQAADIYRQHIWEKHNIAAFPRLIGWTYADAIVNHGLNRATRLIQAGLGVKVDGVIGPVTRQAALDANVFDYWQGYRRARVAHYAAIVERRPSQLKFYKGWVNRIFIMMEWAYDAQVFGHFQRSRNSAV